MHPKKKLNNSLAYQPKLRLLYEIKFIREVKLVLFAETEGSDAHSRTRIQNNNNQFL